MDIMITIIYRHEWGTVCFYSLYLAMNDKFNFNQLLLREFLEEQIWGQ